MGETVVRSAPPPICAGRKEKLAWQGSFHPIYAPNVPERPSPRLAVVEGSMMWNWATGVMMFLTMVVASALGSTITIEVYQARNRAKVAEVLEKFGDEMKVLRNEVEVKTRSRSMFAEDMKAARKRVEEAMGND